MALLIKVQKAFYLKNVSGLVSNIYFRTYGSYIVFAIQPLDLKKNLNPRQCCVPVIPATQKAEVGTSFEPKSLGNNFFKRKNLTLIQTKKKGRKEEIEKENHSQLIICFISLMKFIEIPVHVYLMFSLENSTFKAVLWSQPDLSRQYRGLLQTSGLGHAETAS